MAKRSRGRGKGTRVVVDLGGITLAPKDSRALEQSIRAVVLSSLARIDFKGDVVIRPTLPFGPGTIGIILKPESDF